MSPGSEKFEITYLYNDLPLTMINLCVRFQCIQMKREYCSIRLTLASEPEKGQVEVLATLSYSFCKDTHNQSESINHLYE